MSGRRILFSPLDWGLGHATRIVPLIRERVAAGDTVLIAATGAPAAFLRSCFPELTLLGDIPAYNIRYADRIPFALGILRRMPAFLRTLRAEHRWLGRAIADHRIDEVISDNRYGLWSDRVPCSLITHQLFPIVPAWARPFIHARIHRWIARFDHCLVPDHAGDDNLSGALSHGRALPNVRFIGPLSRFTGIDVPAEPIDTLVLISGPEPHRTRMENTMTEQAMGRKDTTVIVCGRPQDHDDRTMGNARILAHATDEQLAGWIRGATTIICRSGYSTIMDLDALGRRDAVYIPTPGQTEQEYLAHRRRSEK